MKLISSILFCCCAASSAASAQAESPCPIERGNYGLNPDSSFTAGFKRIPKQEGQTIVLFIQSRKTGTTYWFSFDKGNGVTDTYLYAIHDPEQQGGKAVPLERQKGGGSLGMSFFTLNKSMQVFSEPPQSSEAAPAYLFIPALSANLFYFGPSFGLADLNARENVPRGLFALENCR